MQNYKIWIIISIIALFIGIVIGVGIGGINTKLNNMGKRVVAPATIVFPTVTVAPTIAPTKVIERMPEEFRNQYLTSCAEDPRQKAYCECTLNELEKKYSTSEILTISIQYAKDNKLPQALINAAASCLRFYKN